MRAFIVGVVAVGLHLALPTPEVWAAMTCASAAESNDVDLCGQALFSAGPAERNATLYKECVIDEMKKLGFVEGKDFTVRVVKDPASELNGAVCKTKKK